MPGLARRILIAISFLACLTAAVLSYRDELESRKPIEAAIAESLLEARRPEEVRTLRYQPAADIRSSYFAIMTLDDLYRPVSLRDLTADQRGLWLQSLVKLDAQLAVARDLELDSLARRPGWAYHHALVGELEYGRLRRESIRAMADNGARWELPLRNGIASAPGDTWLATYLAFGYLSTWGEMTPAEDLPRVFARAMLRDEFVRQYYRIVTTLMGDAAAIALLPDNPQTLRVALAREKKDERVEAAAALVVRIDAAEREGRARDLEKIRERSRLRDVWGQRAAAGQWVARYRPEYLDDDAGRAEVAEVFSLWPGTKRGSWLNDPRANLVRYFLSGRERSIAGATIESAVSLLSDVPDPVRARSLALAGRTWEADQMARSSSTAGSFEWTPVFVDLARGYLEEDKRDLAASTLERIAPAARDECNVLLLRRALDSSDREAVRVLDGMNAAVLVAARGEVIPLCIDPTRHADARMVVSLSSAGPSLVSYGWDGGRLGSVVVNGQASVELPLSGMAGRHPFRLVTEVGPKATILNVELD